MTKATAPFTMGETLAVGRHSVVYGASDAEGRSIVVKLSKPGHESRIDSEATMHRKLERHLARNSDSRRGSGGSDTGSRLPTPALLSTYRASTSRHATTSRHYTGGHALVLQRVGPDLEKLRRALGGRIPSALAHRIAAAAIRRLCTLHSADILHCDIRPENFALGCGMPALHAVAPEMVLGHALMHGNSVYLLDLGHAATLRSRTRLADTPSSTRGGARGGRFAAGALHRLKRLGRKHDLEALMYTVAFLVTGTLPWDSAAQHVAHDVSAYTAGLASAKAHTRGDDLFGWARGTLGWVFDYVRSMPADAKPDYELVHEALLGGA